MTPRIALFGGSFNPPGLHHRAIAGKLAASFDRVVVVPCGPRPDKPVTNDVDPVYRAAMVDLTFRGVPKTQVELFDLEQSTFTRTHALEARFAAAGEVWHVVGGDLVQGGSRNEAPIQREWMQGPRLWQESRFAVVRRHDCPLAAEDLPPRSEVVPLDLDRSSTTVRQRIFQGESVRGLVVPEVAALIERYRLYRGAPPQRPARWTLAAPRFLVVCDERNDRAKALAKTLSPIDEENPNLIVVIGGDGTMLRAIRQHWRRRAPFFGVNAGHLGFLLNEQSPLDLINESLILEHLPLLYAEAEAVDGRVQSALAFNDAWVERATGQTAWIQVLVDGQERLPQLVADGALVSTAAGSPAYARAMGAIPMPLNTPVLLLVGSNVLRPESWKPVVLPLNAEIELRTLDPVKRPLQGYIDGVEQGQIRALRARVSRTAAVELAFAPDHHPEAKLAQIQFPPPRR